MPRRIEPDCIDQVRAASRLPLWRRLASGFAVVAVALALCGSLSAPAFAADDEEEEESFETKLIKGILGINDRDSIDYRERPPLVVPPNLNALPPPETNALVNSPAWPKDPELVERKKRAAKKKNERRKSIEEEGRALTPAELDVVGRRAGAGRVNPTGPQDAETDGWRAMRPSELGAKGDLLGNLFKDTSKPEATTFAGEPPRTSLTQPPAGYMTPSAKFPYGISPKQEQAKPFDYVNRHGTE